ncbi:unnamed protein product [Prorocentrum cordatum]|uniref:Uncharacterized protein n=1 Tax=Prorocentrum cordatum TaxID=2364126 RepID=A0ABN9RLP3_9DINO|nr:unnamed protein product [Polarella glacialis]
MRRNCRDEAANRPIRVRGEIPLPARQQKDALSCLRETMQAMLVNRGLWCDSRRMSCVGYGSGCFHISTSDDSWTQVASKLDDGRLVIIPSRAETDQRTFFDMEIDCDADIATEGLPRL